MFQSWGGFGISPGIRQDIVSDAGGALLLHTISVAGLITVNRRLLGTLGGEFATSRAADNVIGFRSNLRKTADTVS